MIPFGSEPTVDSRPLLEELRACTCLPWQVRSQLCPVHRLAGIELALQSIHAFYRRARREPIGVDISDFGDEFCEGFLRGQVNVLEELERLLLEF